MSPFALRAPARPRAGLRLLQLFDSQFPVGAFAHSGGVETYAALGGVVPELREILHAQIELGWGRSELGGRLPGVARCRRDADARTRLGARRSTR